MHRLRTPGWFTRPAVRLMRPDSTLLLLYIGKDRYRLIDHIMKTHSGISGPLRVMVFLSTTPP